MDGSGGQKHLYYKWNADSALVSDKLSDIEKQKREFFIITGYSNKDEDRNRFNSFFVMKSYVMDWNSQD